MPSLRDLRRRIKSIKSTQQITKAMKAVSAAKMRRAQEQVLSARPYARRMKDVLGRVATAAAGVKHPLLEVREPKRVAYVLITADRGLCGGFNANLIRRTVQETKNISAELSLICVGRKGRDYFRRRGYNIAQQYVGLGETIKLSHAQEVARYVMDKYAAGEFDAVYLIYSEFVNVLVQRPRVVKLLPVEPPEGQENGEGKPGRVEYIFEPSAEAVLSELLPMYVENMVFHGLLESKASEHSARMTAMDNATKNAGDMIDRLTLSMNRARQAAITKEISEIVGGAAALE
ncbi:F0F1 ATP synthase subunit gamma [Desulfofundulus sp. TPOSR]|uniref:ATP synthase gamma chain n=1 Tax=Desulfofundulus kuznetsovii (strain DSM 6115 / VKM B-1805 / 17) TaxID=760568 RepID=A0AAU8PD00_DESK7|nr:ATP synthase F1 subunit gamma [Desulfofundulus sp. TPOSR]AEG16904.1 ATP synthase gamma chain [Desulfofundulus kuznetsovii DSM 6115]NHM26870.1 F0F1 ATP synthase subunit gamma [Desulfofundulus sp. TPOSR]